MVLSRCRFIGVAIGLIVLLFSSVAAGRVGVAGADLESGRALDIRPAASASPDASPCTTRSVPVSPIAVPATAESGEASADDSLDLLGIPRPFGPNVRLLTAAWVLGTADIQQHSPLVPHAPPRS
jgi:hypothetical protein